MTIEITTEMAAGMAAGWSVFGKEAINLLNEVRAELGKKTDEYAYCIVRPGFNEHDDVLEGWDYEYYGLSESVLSRMKDELDNLPSEEIHAGLACGDVRLKALYAGCVFAGDGDDGISVVSSLGGETGVIAYVDVDRISKAELHYAMALTTVSDGALVLGSHKPNHSSAKAA